MSQPSCLQEEEDQSFALVFVPEDPSEISADSVSLCSPTKKVESQYKSILSKLNSSSASLFALDGLTFDKPDAPEGLPMETKPNPLAQLNQKTNVTKNSPRDLRRSKSSERPIDDKRVHSPNRDKPPERLKSRHNPGTEKSRRLSRNRSTSCIDFTVDVAVKDCEEVSGKPAAPRRIERTRSAKELRSPPDVGSSEPQKNKDNPPQGSDSGKPKSPKKLSARSSKRTITNTTSSSSSPQKEKTVRRKDKPRRKSSRNLSELAKVAAEKDVTDFAESTTPAVPTTRVESVLEEANEKEKGQEKKLARKSSRRALKEKPGTPAAPSTTSSDDKPVVDRRISIRRTMSDIGLEGREDAKLERTLEDRKGAKTPKIKPLQRLQSMKKALSVRINSRKQKNRIDTTELSPFEHHLTCSLWSDDASIVTMALSKLSNLCAIERESSLFALEQVGSSAIVGALRRWWHDVDVQLQGCRLLGLLANDVTDRFIEGAVRCGVFEIIMNSMEISPSDQLLQEHACGAIFTLVNAECSHPSEKFISHLGGLPILLRPILTFPSNDEIQKHVRSTYNSVKRFDHLRDFLELGEPILRKHSRSSSSSHNRRSQKPEDKPHPQNRVSNIIQEDREVVEEPPAGEFRIAVPKQSTI